MDQQSHRNRRGALISTTYPFWVWTSVTSMEDVNDKWACIHPCDMFHWWLCCCALFSAQILTSVFLLSLSRPSWPTLSHLSCDHMSTLCFCFKKKNIVSKIITNPQHFIIYFCILHYSLLRMLAWKVNIESINNYTVGNGCIYVFVWISVQHRIACKRKYTFKWYIFNYRIFGFVVPQISGITWSECVYVWAISKF